VSHEETEGRSQKRHGFTKRPPAAPAESGERYRTLIGCSYSGGRSSIGKRRPPRERGRKAA